MPILPFIIPDLVMSDSVAIVGSSDDLLGSGFGKEIDDFTDVIRFNQAPVDGYEADVGSKTTMRMMGHSILLGLPQSDGDPMFAATLRNTRICHHGNWNPYVGQYPTTYPDIHPSNEFFFFCYDQMDAEIHPVLPANIVLTSGLRMMFSLIRAGIVPHLFGFDLDASNLRNHYWSAVQVPTHGVHNFVREREILRELSDKGKIVLHAKPAKLLDCTLRDGGYQNSWNFSLEFVEEYLRAVNDAHVKYVEIGFRTLHPEGKGYCGDATDPFITALCIPPRLRLGVMINASELIKHSEGIVPALELMFNPAAKSPVSFVRIACHMSEVVQVMPAFAWLKDSGYTTILNLMQISDRTAEEVASVAEAAVAAPIDVLYFADSLGGLDPDRTAEIIRTLRIHWKGEMGIHTHDNRGLGLANSLRAIKEGIDWIDGTVTGMGRGPGNTKTEHLIIELMPQVDLHGLLAVIETNFKPLLDRYRWGCNPFYHLAGKRSIHPTYVQEMLDAGCPPDILEALDQLAGNSKFDRSRLPK